MAQRDAIVAMNETSTRVQSLATRLVWLNAQVDEAKAKVAATSGELARAREALAARTAESEAVSEAICAAAGAEDGELARLFARGAAALDELRARDVGARLAAWLAEEGPPGTPLTLLLVDETLSAWACERYPALADHLCAKTRFHARFLALAALDAAPSQGAADATAVRILASVPGITKATAVCQHPLAGEMLDERPGRPFRECDRRVAMNQNLALRCAARALDLARHLCAPTLVLLLRQVSGASARYRPDSRFSLDILKALINASVHAPALARAAFSAVLPVLTGIAEDAEDAACAGLAYALDAGADAAAYALAESHLCLGVFSDTAPSPLLRRCAEHAYVMQTDRAKLRALNVHTPAKGAWPPALTEHALWHTALTDIMLKHKHFARLRTAHKLAPYTIVHSPDVLRAALATATQSETIMIVAITMSGVEYVQPAHALPALLHIFESLLCESNNEKIAILCRMRDGLLRVSVAHAASTNMHDCAILIRRMFTKTGQVEKNAKSIGELMHACAARCAAEPFMCGWAPYTCMPLFVYAWQPALHMHACERNRKVLLAVLCALRAPRAANRAARLGGHVLLYILSHVYTAIAEIRNMPRYCLKRLGVLDW